MEIRKKLFRYYQQKLSLLKQLTIMNESIIELAKCDETAHIKIMILKKEDIIRQISEAETEIAGLHHSGLLNGNNVSLCRNTDFIQLTINILGIVERMKFTEKEIKDILNRKKDKIRFELNEVSNTRELLRRKVLSKDNCPRYLSCLV